jgi:hypothetical protein
MVQELILALAEDPSAAAVALFDGMRLETDPTPGGLGTE